MPVPKSSFTFFSVLFCFIYSSQALSQTAQFVSFNADTQIGVCVATSPDGANVYVGGSYTIAIFKREENDSLKTIQVLNNDHLGMTGIQQVIDLVVSPDGRHLYAVDILDHSLKLFERNSLSGEINLIESLKDSVFTSLYQVPAEETGYKLLISSDGVNLYWLYSPFAYTTGNVLAVFARDKETGRLEKIQTLRNGDAALRGYFVPQALAISPTGGYLYAVGYNQSNLLAFVRDTITGRIQLERAFEFTGSPQLVWCYSSLAVSKDGASIYASNFCDEKLFAFHRDSVTGAFNLTAAIDKNAAHGVLLSPDDQHLYVSGNDGLSLYTRDQTSGKLDLIQSFSRISFFLPSGYTASPDGSLLFLPSVYRRDVVTGQLSPLQRIDQNIGGTDQLYTSHAVEVSPEGEHLYVAAREPARGIGDAGISLFRRNQSEGRITFAAFDTLTDIGGMLLSPDGRHLYVQSSASNAIQVFARDAQTGVLQMAQTAQPLPKTRDTILYTLSPGMMAFSSEVAHFYFNTSEHLLVYDREASTGQLTLQQTIQIDDYQLGSKSAFALSPEGTHVYWGGYERNVSLHNPRYEMAILARDPASGALTFLKRVSFEGMFPGYAIKVSHDGRHVYAGLLAANYEQNTGEMLGVFARDSNSGELRLQEIMRYSGYENCVDLAIAPNDSDVYAVFDDPGWSGSALAMFERERPTGTLRQRKIFRSWREGIYGLYDPVDFKLSPDGRFIYIADLQGVVTFTTGRENTTAVHGNEAFTLLPRAITLEQNYPNPFSTSTTHTSQGTTLIHYEIAAANNNSVPIELAIYNTQGQLVTMLVNKAQSSGKHASTWNGLNAKGQFVPSGVYFYRLKAGKQIVTKKMLLVR